MKVSELRDLALEIRTKGDGTTIYEPGTKVRRLADAIVEMLGACEPCGMPEPEAHYNRSDGPTVEVEGHDGWSLTADEARGVGVRYLIEADDAEAKEMDHGSNND